MILKSCRMASAAALLTLAGLTGRSAAQCTGYNMTMVQNPPLLPGITDIGLHTDDGVALVALPFPVTIYGQTFTNAVVCTNGQMTMGPTGTSAYSNSCLPATFPNIALAPFWDDLRTDGAGQGIFTATYVAGGFRTFVIEWRAGYYSGYSGTADFAVIFRENQSFFDFEYLTVSDGAGSAQSEGASSTVGVQRSNSGPASQPECNTGGVGNGQVIRFTCAPYSAPACSLSFSPPGGQPGTSFSAFCSVTPGNGPVSTGLAVSLNANPLGGGTVPLHDDGIAPDAVANDNTFSGTVTSNGTMPPAGYVLTSNVSDAQGRSTSCSATYTVLSPCPGYGVTLSQSSLPAGLYDTGNHGDDVLTTITLPFPVSVYGQSFTQATVCSNGQMTMGPLGTNAYLNYCLPTTVLPGVGLAPFWDDLRTDGPGQGIFTFVFGGAPNRILVIEWRAGYYANYSGTANFAVYFYENEPVIDYVYGNVNDGSGSGQSEGAGSTIGIQQSGSGPSTEVGCNARILSNGDWLRFSCLAPTNPRVRPGAVAEHGGGGDEHRRVLHRDPGRQPRQHRAGGLPERRRRRGRDRRPARRRRGRRTPPRTTTCSRARSPPARRPRRGPTRSPPLSPTSRTARVPAPFSSTSCSMTSARARCPCRRGTTTSTTPTRPAPTGPRALWAVTCGTASPTRSAAS